MKILPVTKRSRPQNRSCWKDTFSAHLFLRLSRQRGNNTHDGKSEGSRSPGGKRTSSGDERRLVKAREGENVTDEFQTAITSYLVALSREQLSEEVSNELPVLLHTVNDLERIGDHAVNIVELAERKIAQKIIFTEVAQGEAGS